MLGRGVHPVVHSQRGNRRGDLLDRYRQLPAAFLILAGHAEQRIDALLDTRR